MGISSVEGKITASQVFKEGTKVYILPSLDLKGVVEDFKPKGKYGLYKVKLDDGPVVKIDGYWLRLREKE
jgi:hypothetical protein